MLQNAKQRLRLIIIPDNDIILRMTSKRYEIFGWQLIIMPLPADCMCTVASKDNERPDWVIALIATLTLSSQNDCISRVRVSLVSFCSLSAKQLMEESKVWEKHKNDHLVLSSSLSTVLHIKALIRLHALAVFLKVLAKLTSGLLRRKPLRFFFTIIILLPDCAGNCRSEHHRQLSIPS